MFKPHIIVSYINNSYHTPTFLHTKLIFCNKAKKIKWQYWYVAKPRVKLIHMCAVLNTMSSNIIILHTFNSLLLHYYNLSVCHYVTDQTKWLRDTVRVTYDGVSCWWFHCGSSDHCGGLHGLLVLRAHCFHCYCFQFESSVFGCSFYSSFAYFETIF